MHDTVRMETMQPEPTEAPDTSGLEAAIRDMPLGAEDDLEISLMPDGDEPEGFSEPAPEQREVATSKASRSRFAGIKDALADVRLMPLLAVTLILVVCFAGVYWVLTRPAREPIAPIRTVLDDREEREAQLAEQAGADGAVDGEGVDLLMEPGEGDQAAGGDAQAGGDELLAGDAAAAAEDEGSVDFEITGQGPPPGDSDQMIPEELPPAVDGTATRLIDVASFTVEGATQVAVRGNGTFLKGRVQVSRLENPARVWIRIKNIGTFYRPNFIPVDSPDVKMVRIGHHPEESPPSIYVVLDLANDRAKVQETWLEGDTFRVAVESQ
jgi:hypothetical protein